MRRIVPDSLRNLSFAEGVQVLVSIVFPGKVSADPKFIHLGIRQQTLLAVWAIPGFTYFWNADTVM